MTAKLGVFTDDLDSEFEPAVLLAARLGLDGVAVRNVGGRNITEAGEPEVRLMARFAADHGIEIASIGSQVGRGFYLDGGGDHDPDFLQRKAEADLASALRHAEVLDSPLIRFFACWLPGREPLETWHDRPDFSLCLGPLVDRISPLVRMAEQAGRTLMIELEGASYVGQVAEARQVMQAIESPSLALCWDVCNGWWSGEHPRDGYERVQGLRLVDVQTKDVPARADDVSQPTFGREVSGRGDVGYEWLLPKLLDDGYEGYITAERVHHPLRPQEHPDLLEATLADIDGITRITTGHSSTKETGES